MKRVPKHVDVDRKQYRHQNERRTTETQHGYSARRWPNRIHGHSVTRCAEVKHRPKRYDTNRRKCEPKFAGQHHHDSGNTDGCDEEHDHVRAPTFSSQQRLGRFFGHDWSASPSGRFLRHRFSPKPKVVATPNSLPKRNHIAKEAVSAARQTKTRQRSERICEPNDAPRTKPRPCVKTMLSGTSGGVRHAISVGFHRRHDRRANGDHLVGRKHWGQARKCRAWKRSRAIHE